MPRGEKRPWPRQQTVSAQTADEINRSLRRLMEKKLACYEAHPEQIEARLSELEREWDVERTLEANASSLPSRERSWRPR